MFYVCSFTPTTNNQPCIRYQILLCEIVLYLTFNKECITHLMHANKKYISCHVHVCVSLKCAISFTRHSIYLTIVVIIGIMSFSMLSIHFLIIEIIQEKYEHIYALALDFKLLDLLLITLHYLQYVT